VKLWEAFLPSGAASEILVQVLQTSIVASTDTPLSEISVFLVATKITFNKEVKVSQDFFVQV